MLTLTSFLLARIAEDENRLDCGINWHDGATYGDSPTSLTCECDFRDKRECAAKRRIVGIAANVLESWEANHGRPGRSMWPDVNRRERHHANETLYALALPYADHPDWREEWRA